MKGLKIIPHSTLENTNIKDIVKALHEPKRYTERYNFACLDKLLEEGEPIPIKKLFKRGSAKKLLKQKEDTDLLVIQNTFIYEIQITNKSIDFILLNRDLDKVKRLIKSMLIKSNFLII